MPYEHILYEINDPVATITLNRPDRLNAMNYPMLAEIRNAVEDAAADTKVVGIVITGAGRGFSAGLDMEDLANSTSGGAATLDKPVPDEAPGLFSYFLTIPKPIIAAVNGPAAGGGFVLAVLSDIRVAAPEAAFTVVFSKRALVAEHGISWVLPRLVGTGNALDLMWSSRKVGGEEAHRIGLAERLAPAGGACEMAQNYVRELAANVAPKSLRAMKEQTYRHWAQAYDPAARDTYEYVADSLDWPDSNEGVASFVERRPPKFERVGE